MKKACIAFGVFMGLVLFPPHALPWGVATHAYYAHELGRTSGWLNTQEIYGSMLPDMFNLMFASPYQEYLFYQMHCEFMKFDERAQKLSLNAVSDGIASHNDLWGADFTANHSGITTPGMGYIWQKCTVLEPVMSAQLTTILVANGISPEIADAWAMELSFDLAEYFIEPTIDILVKRNETKIRRLVYGSWCRRCSVISGYHMH